MPRRKKAPPDPFRPVMDAMWPYIREYGVTRTANALGVSNNWLHRRRRTPGILRLKDIHEIARVVDIPGEVIRGALPW